MAGAATEEQQLSRKEKLQRYLEEKKKKQQQGAGGAAPPKRGTSSSSQNKDPNVTATTGKKRSVPSSTSTKKTGPPKKIAKAALGLRSPPKKKEDWEKQEEKKEAPRTVEKVRAKLTASKAEGREERETTEQPKDKVSEAVQDLSRRLEDYKVQKSARKAPQTDSRLATRLKRAREEDERVKEQNLMNALLSKIQEAMIMAQFSVQGAREVLEGLSQSPELSRATSKAVYWAARAKIEEDFGNPEGVIAVFEEAERAVTAREEVRALCASMTEFIQRIHNKDVSTIRDRMEQRESQAEAVPAKRLSFSSPSASPPGRAEESQAASEEVQKDEKRATPELPGRGEKSSCSPMELVEDQGASQGRCETEVPVSGLGDATSLRMEEEEKEAHVEAERELRLVAEEESNAEAKNQSVPQEISKETSGEERVIEREKSNNEAMDMEEKEEYHLSHQANESDEKPESPTSNSDPAATPDKSFDDDLFDDTQDELSKYLKPEDESSAPLSPSVAPTGDMVDPVASPLQEDGKKDQEAEKKAQHEEKLPSNPSSWLSVGLNAAASFGLGTLAARVPQPVEGQAAGPTQSLLSPLSVRASATMRGREKGTEGESEKEERGSIVTLAETRVRASKALIFGSPVVAMPVRRSARLSTGKKLRGDPQQILRRANHSYTPNKALRGSLAEDGGRLGTPLSLPLDHQHNVNDLERYLQHAVQRSATKAPKQQPIAEEGELEQDLVKPMTMTPKVLNKTPKPSRSSRRRRSQTPELARQDKENLLFSPLA